MPALKTWLQSSHNPSEVSNTIKGLVLGASALIIFIAAQFFHVQLTANDVIALGTEAGALAGGMWFLYGLIFKGVMYVGSVRR